MNLQRVQLVTMALFRRLALETAEQWHYRCPTFSAEKAMELVRKLYASRACSAADMLRCKGSSRGGK